MRQIEHITLKGTTYFLFNRQDLIDLIYDQMGSKVAALLETEFKEMQEDYEEQIEELQALKDTQKGKRE